MHLVGGFVRKLFLGAAACHLLSGVHAGAKKKRPVVRPLDLAAVARMGEIERTRNAELENDLRLLLNVDAESPVFVLMREQFKEVEGGLPAHYKKFIRFRQMIPKGNWEFLRRRIFQFEFISEMFQAMDSLVARARFGNLRLYHDELVKAVNDVLEQGRLLTGRIQSGDVLGHAVALQLGGCEAESRCELLRTRVRQVLERGVYGAETDVSSAVEYGEALVVASIVAKPLASTPELSTILFPGNWKHW